MNFLTPIERWNPEQDLLQLRDRVNRFFRNPLETEEPRITAFTPACDIVETKDALVLRAELPGVKKEDVNVELAEGMLTVSGEKGFEKETKEKNYHRIERSYGTFARSFTLPNNVAADKIHATFDDGVLEVEIPKTAEAKAKKIPIVAPEKKAIGIATAKEKEKEKER